MKKLKYAVILLLGLSMATTMMTSCKKDNENNGGNNGGNNSYQSKIIGKWLLTEEIYWVYDVTNDILGDTCHGNTMPYMMEFTADGVCNYYLFASFPTTYYIEGNSLKIKGLDSDDYSTQVIDELTDSTMVLSSQKSWTDEEGISYKKTTKEGFTKMP